LILWNLVALLEAAPSKNGFTTAFSASSEAPPKIDCLIDFLGSLFSGAVKPPNDSRFGA